MELGSAEIAIVSLMQILPDVPEIAAERGGWLDAPLKRHLLGGCMRERVTDSANPIVASQG